MAMSMWPRPLHTDHFMLRGLVASLLTFVDNVSAMPVAVLLPCVAVAQKSRARQAIGLRQTSPGNDSRQGKSSVARVLVI